MRITYLKLVNFKNILSAMNRRILEIDFSKSKNRIILFLGENGSGKSSILRELHPFPNSGNTDNRNVKELIMEDCEGCKELHIEDGNDIIKIKHIYSKSGSVKSFYTKNNQELNPNGNVTSFLEVLYYQLGLTKDFLSLLRLGANDSNFIKMSATERKKFTVSLLDETAIYLKLYRYISEDLRVTRATLKSVAEKLNRMKIYNLEEIDEELLEVSKILEKAQLEQTKIVEDKAVLKTEVDNFLGSLTVNEKQNELQSKNKELAIIKDKIESFDKSLTVEELDKEINHLTTSIELNKRDKENYETNINELNTRLAEYNNTIDKFEAQLGNFNIEEESKLESLIESYKSKIENTFSKYKDIQIDYTVEDLKEGLDLMIAINNVCSLMIGFNDKAKHELVELYIEKPDKNHESYIASMMVDAERKLEKAKMSRDTQIHRSKIEYSENRLMFKPAGCQYTNCSMEAFYRSLTEQENFDTKEIDRTIVKLEKAIQNVEDYYAINSNIQYIKMIMESNSRLISKLPEDLIKFDKILRAIETDTVFYNEEEVTMMITIAENKAMYDELQIKLDNAIKDLSSYKEKTQATSMIREELGSSIKRRDETLKTLSTIRVNKNIIDKEIETNTSKLERLKEKRILAEEINELETLRDELSNYIKVEAETLLGVIEKINKIDSLDKRLTEVSYVIRTCQDKSETLRRNKILYKEYREEQKELEEKYQDQVDIQDTLSSKEGIPLIYMKVYMMDSTDHINNLLNIAYGGNLEVEKIVIDDTVFKIPYIKNGISVPDVKSCSQGEEAFLNIAISFAFISRSIERYNILLFDEIDAALDTRKRLEFLTILNTELDHLGAEQTFFITHNNAFYDMPVDVVITSPVNIESYKNVNVIFDATKS